MTELTFKRIRAGYYRTETTTILENEGEETSTEVVIHVSKKEWNGPDTWAVEIWRKGNEHATYGLVTGTDCPCRTYKAAKEQAALIVAKGFKWYSGSGYCGRH